MPKNGVKVIKIVTCHDGGGRETLALHFPFALREGVHFNILTDGTGRDYYFDFDGYYDGWSEQVKQLVH